MLAQYNEDLSFNIVQATSYIKVNFTSFPTVQVVCKSLSSNIDNEFLIKHIKN